MKRIPLFISILLLGLIQVYGQAEPKGAVQPHSVTSEGDTATHYRHPPVLYVGLLLVDTVPYSCKGNDGQKYTCLYRCKIYKLDSGNYTDEYIYICGGWVFCWDDNPEYKDGKF